MVIECSFNQQENLNDTQLEPVYRIKEGIKQKQLRDHIRQSLNDVVIHEWLSDELRNKYKLETLEFTLNHLHHPKVNKTYLEQDVLMHLQNYLCLNYACNG